MISFQSDLPVNDDKGGHILLGCKILVASGHDEADDSLEEDSNGKGVARTHPVTSKGSESRARDVEEVGQSGPAEGLPQGRVGTLDER